MTAFTQQQREAEWEALLDLETVALMALVKHGVPSDVQEVLTTGTKRHGVPPGALRAALAAVLPVIREAERAAAFEEAAEWHDERAAHYRASAENFRGGSNPRMERLGVASTHERSAQSLRALAKEAGI